VATLVAAMTAACSSGSSSSTTQPTSSTSAKGSAGTTAVSKPTPASLVTGHRIVAFYGEAGAPKLGVLGTAGPGKLWPRLAHQAAAYRGLGKPVVPAYELITFLATSGSSERMPTHTIKAYAAAVRRHHGLLILDIQPGHGRMLPDAKRLEPWLVQPDVELALDPEWELHGRQRAGKQIGHTTAAEVNAVSAWLDRLTAAHRLPTKLLLIHQFTPDMVRDKTHVVARHNLVLTFNMDGFGSRSLKREEYRSLAHDRRFPLGMKLFYTSDTHMLTPHEVVRLHPAPDVVDYE
jgi:hypothetical protein